MFFNVNQFSKTQMAHMYRIKIQIKMQIYSPDVVFKMVQNLNISIWLLKQIILDGFTLVIMNHSYPLILEVDPTLPRW